MYPFSFQRAFGLFRFYSFVFVLFFAFTNTATVNSLVLKFHLDFIIPNCRFWAALSSWRVPCGSCLSLRGPRTQAFWPLSDGGNSAGPPHLPAVLPSGQTSEQGHTALCLQLLLLLHVLMSGGGPFYSGGHCVSGRVLPSFFPVHTKLWLRTTSCAGCWRNRDYPIKLQSTKLCWAGTTNKGTCLQVVPGLDEETGI